MAFRNNLKEIYDSSCSSSNDVDIDYLYNELYDSLLKVKKELKSTNNKNKMLNEEIKMIMIENDMLSVMTKKPLVEFYNYNKCKVFKAKIRNLNKILQCFATSKNKLTNILGN